MLVFIGLGLTGNGITLKGLEELQKAEKAYAELYTSLIPELDLEKLESKIEKNIKVLQREDVEQNPQEVLESAKKKKVAFLVPGDPMIATTHVDLRLRAEESGIETKIIHSVSIETAAPGLAGLQSYKFGRSATLPFPDKPSETPYEVLEKNQDMGLHTLFLLDIEAEEEKYLTADQAIKTLLELENKLGRKVFTKDTLTVVVGRAGSSDSIVKGGKVKDLVEEDFGAPPQVLIVPGNLHFLEAEALEEFAKVPKEVVQENVEE
ncbi:hypothetical protein AKJ53_01225 [candidate division MSBL1 archaeon SCGC-AAA382F02]|uniref:Diphthine synthase n=1 Tax=candidate division MSBL1 archaeon SCGC-AAA382F02 TaxID=1698282 RepID=A0A133VI84_9EURY|nr:hypothetical protein AKJ53_01225 [candidate division MSBL1 archaeon SCGC-AAA382F02]